MTYYEIRLFQPVDHRWCADAYERTDLADGSSLVRISASAGRTCMADAAREAVQEIEKHMIMRSAAAT